jgi:protein-S-isoprenylcysteine O-methyltransferase Ste14
LRDTLPFRAARTLLITLVAFAALMLVPAGSFYFWQAWLLLGVMALFWTYFLVDLLKRDPQLVERRLRHQEPEPEHQRFRKLFTLILPLGLIVTGLDFRFAWTRSLVTFPLWLTILGQLMVVAAYTFVFWVMRTNTFAGSTIQVEAEQTVISSGPYAIVRHPMYLGMLVMALGIPIALQSCVALPLFALFLPIFVYRIVHEERTLRSELAGYSEYCQRVRYRLIPPLW